MYIGGYFIILFILLLAGLAIAIFRLVSARDGLLNKKRVKIMDEKLHALVETLNHFSSNDKSSLDAEIEKEYRRYEVCLDCVIVLLITLFIACLICGIAFCALCSNEGRAQIEAESYNIQVEAFNTVVANNPQSVYTYPMQEKYIELMDKYSEIMASKNKWGIFSRYWKVETLTPPTLIS